VKYIGGKWRQGAVIAQFAKHVLTPDSWYVEPFCGALWSASFVHHRKMLLNDTSEALVMMWAWLLAGWTPPKVIDEADYARIRRIKDPKDPLTAYVGFGMSFGAKWFGGYARHIKGVATPEQETAVLNRSLERKLGLIKDSEVVLSHGSYADLAIPAGAVIYCDPPYAGRTKGHNFGDFDHDAYWQWVRFKVMAGHPVLATEFTIPPDFVVLHSWGDTVSGHHNRLDVEKRANTDEVLVCHESQVHLFKDAK